jgi:hypothetical protein
MLGVPPVRVDVRPGREIDREMLERSQRLAQEGAQLHEVPAAAPHG